MGGDDEMMRFLADLHARREFRPFTTEDLIEDVLVAQDTIGPAAARALAPVGRRSRARCRPLSRRVAPRQGRSTEWTSVTS
jgi:hypothetical protein